MNEAWFKSGLDSGFTPTEWTASLRGNTGATLANMVTELQNDISQLKRQVAYYDGAARLATEKGLHGIADMNSREAQEARGMIDYKHAHIECLTNVAYAFDCYREMLEAQKA